MLIAVKNNKNFDKSIKDACIIAEKRGNIFFSLLTQPEFHMELFAHMQKDPGINSLRMGNDMIFMKDGFRIELIQINATA